MVNGINASLNGLNLATQKANQAATNIANFTTPGIGESVNLTEEIINLKVSEIAFKANASVLRVQGELSDEIFRIFDEEI